MRVDLRSECPQKVCQKGDGLNLGQLEVHEDVPANIIHLFWLYSCAHKQMAILLLLQACETHQENDNSQATLHKERQG